jgi:hypothetical protein
MLSKQELEEIIKAWPDENGNSSNPDVYFKWIEMERDHCRIRISEALGRDRIEALSDRQYRLLEKSLEKLFATKSHLAITDEEILGRYELITEHVSPITVETYVDALKRRDKLH